MFADVVVLPTPPFPDVITIASHSYTIPLSNFVKLGLR